MPQPLGRRALKKTSQASALGSLAYSRGGCLASQLAEAGIAATRGPGLNRSSH